jgi:two-component system response regulator HupR/HoxA
VGAAAALAALARERDQLTLSRRAATARPAPPVAARAADHDGFERIVRAPGSPMEAVCRLAAQVASFDVPALLLGETGVGKELLARAIHAGSLRGDRPFRAVHCGAIPDELLESELFGHCKGAFTGAHAAREGLLQQGDGGTVFLDEIGDTSPAFQMKMLRFLQQGEIRPVGGDATVSVDVRVIAATNRDLEAEVRAGRFREDLYFRLAVCPIRIPPLRERPADIAPLAQRLLHDAMAAHGKRVGALGSEVTAQLAAHVWPGNVRELANEILRMLMLCAGDRLSVRDLSPGVLRAAPADQPADPMLEAALACRGPLKDRVERLEARILREALLRHGWNKSRAADELGLSRVGLRAKMDRYHVTAPGERPVAMAAE